MVMEDDPIIEKLLEDIFFDSEELELLKKEIKQVALGVLDPVHLKKTIWKSRTRFKEEMITDFLPYCLGLKNYSSSDNSRSSELQQKLKDREELLETIAKRINTLYQKLRQKSDSASSVQELTEIISDSSIQK